MFSQKTALIMTILALISASVLAAGGRGAGAMYDDARFLRCMYPNL